MKKLTLDFSFKGKCVHGHCYSHGSLGAVSALGFFFPFRFPRCPAYWELAVGEAPVLEVGHG